jgi:hypothetical protein
MRVSDPILVFIKTQCEPLDAMYEEIVNVMHSALPHCVSSCASCDIPFSKLPPNARQCDECPQVIMCGRSWCKGPFHCVTCPCLNGLFCATGHVLRHPCLSDVCMVFSCNLCVKCCDNCDLPYCGEHVRTCPTCKRTFCTARETCREHKC